MGSVTGGTLEAQTLIAAHRRLVSQARPGGMTSRRALYPARITEFSEHESWRLIEGERVRG